MKNGHIGQINKATDMLTKTGINLPAASKYVSLAKNSISRIETNVNRENEEIRKSKKPLDDGKAKMTMEDRIVEQKPRPMDFDERVMDETRREAEAREGAQEKRNRHVQTTEKADTSDKYSAGRVSDLTGVAYSLGEAVRGVDRCVKLLKEMTDEPASALAGGEVLLCCPSSS